MHIYIYTSSLWRVRGVGCRVSDTPGTHWGNQDWNGVVRTSTQTPCEPCPFLHQLATHERPCNRARAREDTREGAGAHLIIFLKYQFKNNCAPGAPPLVSNKWLQTCAPSAPCSLFHFACNTRRRLSRKKRTVSLQFATSISRQGCVKVSTNFTMLMCSGSSDSLSSFEHSLNTV